MRKLQTVPARRPQPEPSRGPKTKTLKNRERARQMNLGYVVFLTIAAIAVLLTCINYLQLQSEITNRMNHISTLEAELNTMKVENDAEYNRVTSSVDLEHVKEVAIGELGMVYATEEQVRLYENQESDYVRQYEDIPKTDK